MYVWNTCVLGAQRLCQLLYSCIFMKPTNFLTILFISPQTLLGKIKTSMVYFVIVKSMEQTQTTKSISKSTHPTTSLLTLSGI